MGVFASIGGNAYPPDILWAVSGPGDETRTQNCVALDFGSDYMWHYDFDGEMPDHPVPPYVHAPTPNLRTILDEVTALARVRSKSASVYLSFAPGGQAKQECLKMLISTDTPTQRETLIAHKPFRTLLATEFRRQMESSCADHGFDFLGFVFSSTQEMKKPGGEDWELIDDWTTLPVQKDI
jgi:hypothetical protein